MPKTINLNHCDTAVPDISALSLPRSILNFGADYRVRSDEPKEAVITNLTSPIGKGETFKFGCSDVKNIYQNTPIDASAQSPSKRGVQVLVQLKDCWTISDSVLLTEYTVPVEGHIVLKIPSVDGISSTDIEQFVGRLVSGLFETGSSDGSRIESMFRGSLLPRDV